MDVCVMCLQFDVPSQFLSQFLTPSARFAFSRERRLSCLKFSRSSHLQTYNECAELWYCHSKSFPLQLEVAEYKQGKDMSYSILSLYQCIMEPQSECMHHVKRLSEKHACESKEHAHFSLLLSVSSSLH